MNIPQLTFARFLAAFLILLFHFAKENVFPFDLPYLNKIVINGNFAVSFFFFLSGFVMILANFNKTFLDKRKYYINRFARIYPIFFISTFLFLIIWVLSKHPLSVQDSVISFLMVQSWIPGKENILNTPAWSLGVELFFYLLFPFLFSFYKKYSFRKISVFVWLFFFLSQIFINTIINKSNHDFVFYNPIFHLNTFLIGNWTAMYYIKNEEKFSCNNDLGWLFSVVLLLLFVIYNEYIVIHNGFLVMFFVPLLLLYSGSNGFLVSLFKRKSYIFFGEISYSFYILQFPFFIPLNRFLIGKNINGSLNFYICTIFLLFVSILAYKLIEVPARRILNSTIYGR